MLSKSNYRLIKMIINKFEQLYKSRSSLSLLLCSIQVCVNTMPRRKDISNDPREAIVAAHQSGKGYKAISKLFRVHHSTERKIIHKWKTIRTAVNLPRSGRLSKFTPRSKSQELHLRLYRPQLAC